MRQTHYALLKNKPQKSHDNPEVLRRLLRQFETTREPDTAIAYVDAFFSLFDYSGKKIYKVTSLFGSEIHKHNEPMFGRDLSPTVPVCVEAPGTVELRTTDDFRLHCCYITILPEVDQIKEIYFVKPLAKNDQYLTMFEIGTYQVKADQPLTEVITNEDDLFWLKMLRYIHTGKPDLRCNRPFRFSDYASRTEEKKPRSPALQEAIRVGWSWKKKRISTARTGPAVEKSVKVSPFVKWQAYGPNRSLLKLIKIDGHKRAPRGSYRTESLEESTLF